MHRTTRTLHSIARNIKSKGTSIVGRCSNRYYYSAITMTEATKSSIALPGVPMSQHHASPGHASIINVQGPSWLCTPQEAPLYFLLGFKIAEQGSQKPMTSIVGLG